MAQEVLASKEKWWHQVRRIIVPDWIWQLTWLRHLPSYHRMVSWKECTRSKWQVVFDMLYIFCLLRTVPEHYGPNRLWEVPRRNWVLYYGCPYSPVQRSKIAKRVYPFEYEIVYNDKLVGAQLGKGLSIKQPVTLGMLSPAEPFRQKLTELVNQHGKLILKPVYGRSGIGIVITERTDAGVVVHTGKQNVALADFTLEDPVFIQQVVKQDARMAALFASSVNTIRAVTIRTPDDRIIVAGCVLRCGVGNSFVDNWSAGGVAVGIDLQTGRLRKHASDWTGTLYEKHPTTGFTFDGFQVPEWERILETARIAQRELPFSKMLGADICLDEHGDPLVIELNGLPDIGLLEQMNGPLLADPIVLKAFAEYDILVSPGQRRLVETATTARDSCSVAGASSPA